MTRALRLLDFHAVFGCTITNKAVAGGPQYTLRIRDWQTDAQVAADAFAFKAPDGASKVEVKALAQTDEVPHGAIRGGKQ